MLSTDQLSVKYGSTTVVNNLNLSLAKDEILMLVGPTGCGKSTILKALAGLVPIAAGKISLGSWQVSPDNYVPPEKRNMGMVFQDFALFPHLTVEQNIAFRLNDSEKVDHWINLLGLNALRRAKPNNISGGQKQRVALARTLAHQPSFVLLDEPLSNLDAALKDDLRWEIRQALKTAKTPAIWVTHDQEEALSIGDKIGILNKGELQQLDKPEICYSRPANRFVARFLGEANFLSATLNASNQQISTSIGIADCIAKNISNQEVDVLIRPDDLSIEADEKGNAKIIWGRYEGSSHLYAVQLHNGELIKVRSSHNKRFKPGENIKLNIIANHPLVFFEKK